MIKKIDDYKAKTHFQELVDTPISVDFNLKQKANALLDSDTSMFNKIVFQLLIQNHHVNLMFEFF